MRFYYLLLVISTASFQLNAATIRLESLVSDLEIFKKMLKDLGTDWTAYITLPDKSVLKIQTAIWSDDYLKIDGEFLKKSAIRNLFSHPSVYASEIYYKNKIFYRPTNDQYQEISGKTDLTYSPNEKQFFRTPYISTHYFNLEDLKTEINNFYTFNKRYFLQFSDFHDVKFLATTQNSRGHFVEYKFQLSNTIIPPQHVAERLSKEQRALFGSQEPDEMVMKRNVDINGLFYNPDYHTFTPIGSDEFVGSLLGVRMSNTAHLAIQESISQPPVLLSRSDLDNPLNVIKNGHEIPASDFLKKIKKVEPTKESLDRIKLRSTESFTVLTDRNQDKVPEVQLHIKGHLLEKKGNYLANQIDVTWPFVVQFHRTGHFIAAGYVADKIYTNDKELSIPGPDGCKHKIVEDAIIQILYQDLPPVPRLIVS